MDGGGIKGILPAMQLVEIEKRTEMKCYELFDVIAGVSIGSLIGAGLSTEFSAQEIVDEWQEDADNIFSFWNSRKTISLNGLKSPKWRVRGLERLLRNRFQGALLKDCKTELVIPAYDTANGKEWHFERNIALNDSIQSELKIFDVVRASSAAPGYFQPYSWEGSSSGISSS